MQPLDIILTIIIISAFCTGWYRITRDGAVLGFCERGHVHLEELIVKVQNVYRLRADSKRREVCKKAASRLPLDGSNGIGIEDQLPPEPNFFRYVGMRALHFVLKPIIGCGMCFASFWGFIIFTSLHGLHWEVIICCISAAFTNVLFINLSE